jgi:hypothetical protein
MSKTYRVRAVEIAWVYTIIDAESESEVRHIVTEHTGELKWTCNETAFQVGTIEELSE